MNIIKPNWHWRVDPSVDPLNKSEVDSIALHHMAHPTADIWEIEKWHLERDNGTWKGFAYNWWVGFDGSIYEGRGVNEGAGVLNENGHIVSIGFQGDYDGLTKVMPYAQFKSGLEVIQMVKGLFPNIKYVDGHNHWQNTSCPGKYFPLNKFIDSQNPINIGGSAMTVIDFQTKYGLVADGIVGPITTAKMLEVIGNNTDYKLLYTSLVKDIQGISNKYKLVEG